MTATQRFIEDAIKGGWGYGSKFDFWCPTSPWSGTFYMRGSEGVQWSTHANTILLDPLAWQSVGKTRGWDELTDGRKWESTKFGFMPVWKYYWHRFIDHLADGLSIEDSLSKTDVTTGL
jgi:hypothetical protein